MLPRDYRMDIERVKLLPTGAAELKDQMKGERRKPTHAGKQWVEPTIDGTLLALGFDI